ncbi:glycerol-3-phosphate 1-O-acyltransferase PlsY [Primorskyibacter sp. 2E233]|uniref:glycerol-3-phosphate 1-O-acyltransferase PlsY n=1 Tax=Primorskyibacter sp. 2E233 TaxID=3413431 RepID=UPI003BEF9C2A
MTAETLPLILWVVIGYLLGSIPFGIIISRVMGLGDLRQIGSGNIGATNVLRTGNKGAAAATLLFDALKGAVAVLLASALAPAGIAKWAGLAAFIGHCYPVWLRFKGGKGVATYLGVVLALSWPVGLLCCATWLFAAIISRISSVAALTAAMSTTVWMFMMARVDLLVMGTILTFLIYWRHRANLARLKDGTEPKIGQK